MRCVLDASVAMRWVVPEGAMPELAHKVRAGIFGSVFEPWVPALWHWEMANAVAFLDRRSILDAGGVALAWEQIESWAAMVQTDPGPSSPVHVAFKLARRHRLTVYDAAYLEVALRLSAPLATLDRALGAAAQAEGVTLL